MTSTPPTSAGPRVVLVVDDDPRLRFLARQALEQAGYAVREASDGAEAKVEVERMMPDLVLLDLVLPRESGADLLQEWRSRGLMMPVIMLTAHGDVSHEVTLLQAGADDYIDKPFEPRILVARISNVLRRTGASVATPDDTLEAGPLRLRVRERVVMVGERRVTLTRTETALLQELMRTPGELRTYDDLLVRLWGATYAGQVEILHTNVYRLRRKLESDPSHPTLLVARPGIGYCLLPDLDEER